MGELRYPNIGIAVTIVLSVVGMLVFRGAGENAMRASVWVSVVVGGVVYLGLEHRADRRHRDRGQ